MSAAAGQSGGNIEVRAFFHLAAMAAAMAGVGGPWRISLHELAPDAVEPTVGMVATRLGIACEPIGMAMVNGSKAEQETVLHPGDRVAFFPEYIPYHRVYGACVV